MSEKRDSVFVTLDPEDREKLEAVKSHYNIKRDADAMRLCINDAYRIMQERNKVFEKIGGNNTDE